MERIFNPPAYRRVMKALAPAFVRFGRRPSGSRKCDVLVLHARPEAAAHKCALVAALQNRDLDVIEVAFPGMAGALLNRQLKMPEYVVPNAILLKAAYAAFLMSEFKPRAIVVSMEFDILSSFLRFEVNRIGGLLINIAHSVTFRTAAFSVLDFDYYFLYGRASLENLKNLPLRLGATRAVLTGALGLAGLSPLPTSGHFRKILYFSTWAPRHLQSALRGQFQDVMKLADQFPEVTLVVRLHPLEDRGYWAGAVGARSNVILQSSDVPLDHALADIDIALSNSASSTPLDALYLNRRALVVDNCEFGIDWYRQFPFLMRRDGETLCGAVERLMSEPGELSEDERQFVTYNLTHGRESAEVAAETLTAIINGESPSDACVIG